MHCILVPCEITKAMIIVFYKSKNISENYSVFILNVNFNYLTINVLLINYNKLYT